MTRRITLPQSALLAHLRILMSRTTNSEQFGSSVVDFTRPGEPSFARMHGGNAKDVDTFKGRLLGVEDGLIDALTHEASHMFGKQEFECPTSNRWFSQPEQKQQLLRSERGLNETLALTTEEPSNPLFCPQPYELPAYPHADSKSHSRCGIVDCNTSAHHILCTCAVTIYGDSIRRERSESDETLAINFETPAAIDLTTEYSTPRTTSSSISSPSISEPELSGAIEKSKEPDDFVVDPVLLEKPGGVALLGIWNMGDWQALEATMSNLIMATGQTSSANDRIL